jgi:ribosomal protein L37AE/L43A
MKEEVKFTHVPVNTIKPTKPCWNCGSEDWWQRVTDGAWNCNHCQPFPDSKLVKVNK